MDADRQRLLDAIRTALEPLPEVQAALLFGSRATGRARTDSDIDVAVLLHPQQAHETGVQLRRLIDALTTQLAADKLDLVILNQAPPVLAFQILRDGVVAFERDPVPLHRFRVRTYSAHADREPVERFFREVTRKRLLGEVRRG